MNFQKHFFLARQTSVRYLIATSTRLNLQRVTTQGQVLGRQIWYLIGFSMLQHTASLSLSASRAHRPNEAVFRVLGSFQSCLNQSREKLISPAYQNQYSPWPRSHQRALQFHHEAGHNTTNTLACSWHEIFQHIFNIVYFYLGGSVCQHVL
jgi:hypothetical protein